MVTFVAIDINVEFSNVTGVPTGNWAGEGHTGTGVTQAAAGVAQPDKFNTDTHCWVAAKAYFDRDASQTPRNLAAGATFVCFFVPEFGATRGSWQSVTLTITN